MGKVLDYRTKWKYKHGIKTAREGSGGAAGSILTLTLLAALPVGLVATRQLPAVVVGILLLPLPILYYLTIYRWQAETRHEIMGFNPSAKATIEDGMVKLQDDNNRARLDLEEIRELAVFIPEKPDKAGHWLIVVLKGLEYLLPGDAQGIDGLFDHFRDDPVFDTYPLDRPDIKPGRWTLWEKEGAG